MAIPQPVAFWKFDDDGDDASGNGRDLESLSFGSFVTGLIGNARRGTIATADTGTASELADVLSSSAFTIAGWINLGAEVDDVVLTIEHQSDGLVSRIYFSHLLGGFRFTISDQDDSWLAEVEHTSSVASGWHLFTIVQQSGQIKAYIDGTLCGTASRTPRSPSGNDTGFSLQSAYSKDFDLWYYFDTALDASQIAELYNDGDGYEWSPPAPSGTTEEDCLFYYLMC